METRSFDQELIHGILSEINDCMDRGVLPLQDDDLRHLSENGEILEYLMFMKRERLIGGAVVTRGINNTPHRMTNISLTHLGRRALQA